jgi:hypothetical protein
MRALKFDFGGAWSTLAHAAGSAEVDAGVHNQLWLHFLFPSTASRFEQQML